MLEMLMRASLRGTQATNQMGWPDADATGDWAERSIRRFEVEASAVSRSHLAFETIARRQSPRRLVRFSEKRSRRRLCRSRRSG